MRTEGGNSSDDALVALSPRAGVVASQADTRRQGAQMTEGRTQLCCVPELVVVPGPAGDGLHPGVLHVRPGDDGTARTPPWRQPRGKSQGNLPQMPPPEGGVCMGFDQRSHQLAPGLPPGRPAIAGDMFRSVRAAGRWETRGGRELAFFLICIHQP